MSVSSSTAAIVLAAGASTRLGEPKQLVRLCGEERLLERAVRIAAEAGCVPVIVVLGANADQIAEECRLAPARTIMNEDWRDGMGSSLRVGVAAIEHAERTIVMTCDQPAVTPGHLLKLMRQCSDGAVASGYDGRRGVPACFPASMFPALMQLTGDTGARVLLASAELVNLPGGGMDVDTPVTLAEARRRFGAAN